VLHAWLNDQQYHAKGGGFMGKKWDAFVPGPAVWRECFRVLKPGGHLLSFFGTRTYDIGTLAIRLVGFEIRDQIAWVFGSGFPKSHDISIAIDKAAGALGHRGVGVKHHVGQEDLARPESVPPHVPQTPEAQHWDGWGTALKPGWEPICLARKPFKGTVASNVLEHGTGGLNIDGCRIPGAKPDTMRTASSGTVYGPIPARGLVMDDGKGRWPANLAHDGSDEVLALLPVSKDGVAVRENGVSSKRLMGWGGCPAGTPNMGYGGSGSAARFFYSAKASSSDRDAGLYGLPIRTPGEKTNRKEGSAGIGARAGAGAPGRNHHPTVKPTDLMRWLVRMVTPRGSIVLDPFMGSGSTGRAAMLEGVSFIGCELDPDYVDLAARRIAEAEGPLFRKEVRVDRC
jgi:site-specific DNA-methyltransferase (adenine-specific)